MKYTKDQLDQLMSQIMVCRHNFNNGVVTFDQAGDGFIYTMREPTIPAISLDYGLMIYLLSKLIELLEE